MKGFSVKLCSVTFMLSGRPRACLFSLSRLNRDSTVSSRVGLCSDVPCWPETDLQDTFYRLMALMTLYHTDSLCCDALLLPADIFWTVLLLRLKHRLSESKLCRKHTIRQWGNVTKYITQGLYYSANWWLLYTTHRADNFTFELFASLC